MIAMAPFGPLFALFFRLRFFFDFRLRPGGPLGCLLVPSGLGFDAPAYIKQRFSKSRIFVFVPFVSFLASLGVPWGAFLVTKRARDIELLQVKVFKTVKKCNKVLQKSTMELFTLLFSLR